MTDPASQVNPKSLGIEDEAMTACSDDIWAASHTLEVWVMQKLDLQVWIVTGVSNVSLKKFNGCQHISGWL